MIGLLYLKPQWKTHKAANHGLENMVLGNYIPTYCYRFSLKSCISEIKYSFLYIYIRLLFFTGKYDGYNTLGRVRQETRTLISQHKVD